jgi:hypothetical protein
MRAHQYVGALFLAVLSLVPSAAGAEASSDLSLFSISKSENKNQVVYAVQVDGACRPVGDAPVHAYWRMLEKGPGRIEPLLSREEFAYGLASQQTEAIAGTEGDRVVRVRLRALPDRTIVIRTVRNAETCAATATATVSATRVSLYNVHARLRVLFGIESLTLSGRAVDGGTVVQETLKP